MTVLHLLGTGCNINVVTSGVYGLLRPKTYVAEGYQKPSFGETTRVALYIGQSILYAFFTETSDFSRNNANIHFFFANFASRNLISMMKKL